MIADTALSVRISLAAFAKWGFEITLLHRGRRGRTGTLSDLSDRSVANHSTTSWWSAKRTFATS